MSGGIGTKKVDVTWATEESGLLLAISVKCLTAKDPKTGNYHKNLINRRGDMLGEAEANATPRITDYRRSCFKPLSHSAHAGCTQRA